AIRRQTYYDIIDALHKSNADDAVNVIVMTGAEGRFSAGNDLSDLLPGADLQALNQCVIDIFDALAGLDKPLILAQEGVAIGIASTTRLHADIADAGNDIRYCLPFAKIDVTSKGACSMRLSETIGPKHPIELLHTTRFVTAAEAAKWGSINTAVE